MSNSITSKDVLPKPTTDVDPPEESPYMCPICLKWLEDPMLTSCGHHFCKKCIASWLERGGVCPIDNQPLEPENDLFPDNYARRQILQQRIKCPNAALGCTCELSPVEIADHRLVCAFRINHCTFAHVGCSFTSAQTEEVEQHLKHDTQKHLMLLCEALAKMSTQYHNGTTSNRNMEQETKGWDPPSKVKPSGSSSNVEELVKNMFERVVVLEQQTKEHEILLANLSEEVKEIKTNYAAFTEEFLLRHCGGVYIWNITDFRNKLNQMRSDLNTVFYSPGFYTSPNGYRFCARIKLSSKDRNYVGFHIHLMQSDNDHVLDWPFNGRISTTVAHPENTKFNIKDTIMSRSELEAFQCPVSPMNPLGFGYTEFVPWNDLINDGFLQTDILTVKIQVQCV